MTTSGIVREWHDDEGWGVIDSTDTPGGCWAHFSSVETPGYRRLHAGQRVTLEFEDAAQDDYAFRARRVAGGGGTDDPGLAGAAAVSNDRGGSAYSSSLTLRYDDPGGR